MRFIVDAQLPYQLVKLLISKGIDAIHTDNLPNKERTEDNEIRNISLCEERIVITKDIDSLDIFYLKSIPPKLLLVTTGNINNTAPLRLFENNLVNILIFFETYCFIELNNDELICHE